VLRHGENALLVPPRDVERLATGMLKLLEQPGLAAALAGQAGNDSRRFDARRTVEKLQNIYQELVDRGR
jgi:glycosyltransferase involved in cell wall biosynthesis